MFAKQFSLAPMKRWLARRLRSTRPLRLRRGGSKPGWSVRRGAVGVEISGDTLYLAYVQPGFRQRWLAATGVIEGFSQLSREQLGQRLREFVKSVDGEQPGLVLGLPRQEVIVRHLRLPAAAQNSLGQMLELQLGLYKPSDDDDFGWGAAVVPHRDQLAVSLVFVPRARIESLAAKFSEAGYPISRLTLGQFSWLDLLLRVPTSNAASRLVCVQQKGRDVELAVIHERQLLYSRSFSIAAETPAVAIVAQAQQALSSLRWTEADSFSCVLAGASEELEQALSQMGKVARVAEWCAAPELGGEGSEPFWGAVALATEGLSWGDNYRLNFLPRELRPVRRRWRHAPAYALAVINVLLLAAFAARGPVQRYLLLRRYEPAVARLEKPAGEVERQLVKEKRMQQQLIALRQFQQQGRQPLDALDEIARKLPSDAWLNLFNFRQGQVEIVGVAKSASALVPALSGSPQLDSVKFTGAVTRESSGEERFRLQMQVRASR